MSAAVKAGRRVLLVEDDEDVRELTSELLRMSGHEVLATRSGEIALELAGEYRPDVALLDLGMPGMDGYVLAHKLKAVLSHAPPRVIALTGFSDEGSRQRSHQAGCDHHFVKPVDLPSLLAAVEGVGPIGHSHSTTGAC